MLPSPDDPRWHSGPQIGGGHDVRFVRYAPPFASAPSSRLDWFVEDGELVLLEDGYPAKRSDAGVLVHPMHPRYVLEDLLWRHTREPTASLRDEIQRTARAVVGRSEARNGVRRLWYEGAAASGLASGRRHVSGLPQAYYARLLTRAARITGDESLADEADAFFAVLTTSVADGGARYDGPAGTSLAMVPMEPRDWILNGWLSMLASIAEYASERPSPEAADLLEENLDTLIRVLPTYDVPDLALSRYMLPGVVQLALDVDPAEGAGLRGLAIAIPGEGRIGVPRREASGWHNRLRPADVSDPDAGGYLRLIGRSARFVVVMSRAPHPAPNIIEFEIDTPAAATIRLRGHLGGYDPLGSRMVDRAWQDLADARVAPGRSGVRLPIPYDRVDLIGYPTSFARTYGGRRLNTYHATHVVRLRQLAERTGREELAFWAVRWRGYIDAWTTMPEYDGFGAWTPEGEV